MLAARLLLWVEFICVAYCLRPVKDFRTPSVQKLLSSGRSTDNALPHAARDVSISASSASLSAAYQINTVSELPSSAATVAVSDEIQFVYTDESQSIYYINATFSDSKTSYNQGFLLLLDSGSDLTWIYDESCSSGACTRDVPKFNDSRNVSTGRTFQLSYSGDTVSGNMLSTSSDDDMTFSIGALLLDSFEFGLANEAPSIFDGFDVSGILGIPSHLGSNSFLSIFTRLYKENLIDNPTFALALLGSNETIEHDVDSFPNNYGGLIFFGNEVAINQKKFTDKVKYLKVKSNDNNYWLVSVTGIKTSNGTAAEKFDSSVKSLQAIIDTGTTGMALPMDDADKVHAQLFGSSLVTDDKGNYAFPCGANANVSISLDGQTFVLPSKDFEGNQYGSQLPGYCASKIQGVPNNDNWILGSIFLRRYFAIFDTEKQQIGLGENILQLYLLSKLTSTRGYSNSSSASGALTSTAQNTSSHTDTKHSKSRLVDSSSLVAGVTYALLCMVALFI